MRLNPGANPPETALAEVYEPPMPGYLAARRRRRSQRRRLDRARERTHGELRSPQMQGPVQRPEGHRPALPEVDALRGAAAAVERCDRSGQRRGSYYTWVDSHKRSDSATNTPIDTGNASEGLLALKDGKWVVLRVPYPIGFYTKWMDGRIDDPKAGWKGRGLWATDEHAHAVPHGDWQGHDEQSDALPVAARSAREIANSAVQRAEFRVQIDLRMRNRQSQISKSTLNSEL